ncbi:SDR family oxidoreductase [Christensenellaceae bacterium OttesenSCG-928-M15]|nr:SDR family oxidoreductase [Christensenellaceae bacterium OttesenSCG-928-M15]
MDIASMFCVRDKRVLIQSPEHPYAEAVLDGFLEAGAQVFVCGEDRAALIRAAERPCGKIMGAIHYAPTREEDAQALALEIEKAAGGLDAFIHASPPPMLKGWDHTFDAIYAALTRSQLHLMLTVKHIGALLAKGAAGSLLFLTDYAALVGCDRENSHGDARLLEEDFSLDYGFVKGSYVNYARQAAGYLGLHNVRCNAIAYAPLPKSRDREFEEAFIRHSHLKRAIHARDIQSAALFLSSDAASYITGVTLPVDGGYTAK